MSESRILVIEDNPKNLKLVRDVLTYFGYEVIAATSGEEGVRLAREQAPDLILMDLQLPARLPRMPLGHDHLLRTPVGHDHRVSPICRVSPRPTVQHAYPIALLG